jgi:hypothetical protein
MSAYLGHDLIFLISQPRSGSTLLQRVLAGHPEIQTSAETWMMLHPVYSRRSSGIETEFNSRWRREAMEEFLTNYTDGSGVYDDAIRAYAEVVYGNTLTRGGKRLFLDKTPRYFFIIEDLYHLFPQAKFIFLLRNPLAVLASELSTYVKGDWKILGWFAPDLIDAPAMIERGARHVGKDGYTIRYEDFVQDPESHTEKLCAYLGITMQPTMVDYSATPAPKGSMNDPVGVHRHSRPTADSAETWRRLADSSQDRHFAHALLDAIGSTTLERLGYDPKSLRAAMGDVPDSTDPRIYPWDLAIKPGEEWRLPERLRFERYEAARRHPGSKLKARFGAWRRLAQYIGRETRYALGAEIARY